MSNTTTNVSLGKPKIGGAVFNAPLGSTLPTDATTALAEAFNCLGYVSEDGLTNSNSPETDQIKAWGGDTVLVTQNEKQDTFQFKLLEVLDLNVLKAVYGSSNVSGSLSSGITVRANATEVKASAWVFELVLTNNAVKRIVIPNAKISEIGDIVYKDDEAIGYEITLNALPGDSNFGGDTHKEYIKRAST